MAVRQLPAAVLQVQAKVRPPVPVRLAPMRAVVDSELTEFETLYCGGGSRDRLLEVSGCNYVLCVFAWGNLTHEQSMRSLRLFSEQVMPAFAS